LTLLFDSTGVGLGKVLSDYQEEAIKYVWRMGDKGVNSRMVWMRVNESFHGKKTISRASIINFLNKMTDEGVLGYREEPCKGGYHRIYLTNLDERAFKKLIARTVIASLLKDFPEETREAMREFIPR
jgi:hypothetical protein